MPRKQRTVRKHAELRGVGLHEGVEARLRIGPAAAGSGVTFVRSDLPNQPRIPARVGNLTERERRTALVGEQGAEVHTVEHFLACCTGLRIDNVEVELDGPECPGMDGSGQAFVELLEEAEPVEQEALRRVLSVERPVSVSGEGGVSLVAFRAQGGLSVSYTLDYGDALPGPQHFALQVTPETFGREIARARTFCLESEAEALRSQGLGKGATYENTLVVGPQGVLENELRWPDEFARHKVLDLLGDLFLLEADLEGHVAAYRSGHTANLDLVRALGRPPAAPAAAGALPAAAPALTHAQIRRILPHRYPFLLVDRVIELEGYQRAVGIKNVSLNEPFFEGHYPDQPIMPGVLILEAMAQLAGLLLLRKLELTGKIPVLLSIDRVKFRRAVVPGDQIRLEAFTLRVASGRSRVRCRSTVDGQLVSEARLNFAMTEPPTA